MTSRRWTTQRRAEALRALWDADVLGVDTYNLMDAWPNASFVEGVLHELAHAVCLGITSKGGKYDISDQVSRTLRVMRNEGSQGRWMWQEILALAAEILVLRQLRMPGHSMIVYRSVERDTVYWPRQFDALVARATMQPATRQRARQLRRWLDKLCEEGRRVQAAQAM